MKGLILALFLSLPQSTPATAPQTAAQAGPLKQAITDLQVIDGEWQTDLRKEDSLVDRAEAELNRSQATAQDRADARKDHADRVTAIVADFAPKWVVVRAKVSDLFEQAIDTLKDPTSATPLSSDQEKIERAAFSAALSGADKVPAGVDDINAGALHRDRFTALIQYLKKLRSR